MYPYVRGTIMCFNQDMEATYVSIRGCMDKKDLCVYVYKFVERRRREEYY